MSVGYITRRVWLSFNNCPRGGLHQPQVRYSTHDDHAGHSGHSGQKRNTLAQVTDLQDQRAVVAAGEEV